MKALTLHQPWAGFVASGIKTVETRSWTTNYRGPLAIHAGRRVVTKDTLALFSGLLSEADDNNDDLDIYSYGGIVATCELVDVVPTRELSYKVGLTQGWEVSRAVLISYGEGVAVDPTQCPYGDFASGRFAWLLANIQRLADPVPARGRQQLWNWNEDEILINAGSSR